MIIYSQYTASILVELQVRESLNGLTVVASGLLMYDTYSVIRCSSSLSFSYLYSFSLSYFCFALMLLFLFLDILLMCSSLLLVQVHLEDQIRERHRPRSPVSILYKYI